MADKFSKNDMILPLIPDEEPEDNSRKSSSFKISTDPADADSTYWLAWLAPTSSS